MKVYAMRNDEGYYLSMSMGKTKDWFEASKFAEDKIESRLEYTDPEFKLVSFEVNEIKEENAKEKLIAFLESNEEDIEFDSEKVKAEEIEAILEELGFEYGEEQDSDGVRYSQFYQEEFGDITIKQSFSSKKYEVTKE